MCGCIFGWPSVAYQFWVTVTSDLFKNNHIWRNFSLLFELGIPNLGCDCILGRHSVTYQLCDLDLISTINVTGAYLLYYLREESQICCMDTYLDADVSHTIFRSL